MSEFPDIGLYEKITLVCASIIYIYYTFYDDLRM